MYHQPQQTQSFTEKMTKTPQKKSVKNYNAYHVSYPVYVMAKITGLAPYACRFTKTGIQWGVTKLGVIQTFLYLLLSVSIIIPTFMYQIRHFQVERNDLISIYSDIFRTANGILVATSLLTTTLINRSKYCTFMNDVMDFDRYFKRLGIEIDNGAMFKRSIRVTITLYVMILLIFVTDFIIFTNERDFLTILYWSGCMFTFIINMSGSSQFLCFLYLIYKR